MRSASESPGDAAVRTGPFIQQNPVPVHRRPTVLRRVRLLSHAHLLRVLWCLQSLVSTQYGHQFGIVPCFDDGVNNAGTGEGGWGDGSFRRR